MQNTVIILLLSFIFSDNIFANLNSSLPVVFWEITRIDLALSKLADPNSDNIDEPYKGLNPSRSKSPEYSVFSGVCTHLGCAPKYFPEVEPKPWDATWNGGFFCPCHGSMFDIVGRVFKGVPAPTNLIVPPHMFDGSILTIGEDKEL